MKDNIFYNKLKLKSDSELESVIDEDSSYVNDAKLAAIQLLKERKSQSVDLDQVEQSIINSKEAEAQKQVEMLEDKNKREFISEDENAPELHSKKVITAFSILFSGIFGAVLLMYNMKQTDNKKGRIQVLVFGIVYTITQIIILDLIGASTGLTLLMNLGAAAILNEYFWNKFIGNEFQYRKRSWLKPAIISIIILIPLVLAQIYA